MKPPTEKEEQRWISSLFQQVGAVVASTSQYRASHVTIGLPDLFVMLPGVHFWYEVKAYRARGYVAGDPSTWVPKPLAEAQRQFAEAAWGSGCGYEWGGRREAEEVLIRYKRAIRTGNGGLLLRRGGG